MAIKDYGPVLTQYLDPTERNFDTVVYQSGRPLLDSEFVLNQEIQNSVRSDVVRSTTPSGWLTGDFSQDGNADYAFPGTANVLHITNRPVVNVNGWVIPVEYTNTSTAGLNVLTLAAPPVGSGNVEVDFVYLEVWRALVSADPSAVNKPDTNKIWRHGNVKSFLAEWLDDDLIDPAVASETTKRVQVQYRLKSTRLADLDDRVGYTDAAIFAQGPNAALTTWTYTEHSTDLGLWVTGDGDPDNTLNTVDGYVYSIPMCMVFRRNSDPFHYLSNGSGGSLIVSGIPDRPDGVYSDEVILDDVYDMRRHVTFQSFDWSTLLTKNTALLMDQGLRSWCTNTTHTGWYVGNSRTVGSRYLMADDITPTSSPDPNSGNTIGHPDGVRMVYSDRAHVQEHVVTFSTGGAWTAPTLTIDLSALSSEMPIGTTITDITQVVLDDSDGANGQMALDIISVTGLGSLVVAVEIDTVGVSSTRDIWIACEVSYPSGAGLSAYVANEAANYQVTVHAPSEYDALVGGTFTDDGAGQAAIRSYVSADFEAGPHREATVYYTTAVDEVLSVTAKDTLTVVLPETILTVTSVEIGVTPYAVASFSGRTITLSGALPAGDSLVDVTYLPKRPLPSTLTPVTLYYTTPGIQALNYPYLLNGNVDNEIALTSVSVGDSLYVGTSSSGSQGTPYPYDAPLNQIPVSINAAYNGEHEINAPGDISIDNFNANTGLLQLPTLVPMVPVGFSLKSPVSVSSQNDEYIHHYLETGDNAYVPSAVAQSLSEVVTHKNFISVLAKLGEDTLYARAGEIVMVIFASHTAVSAENRVGGSSTDYYTCAAIYRLKGNPLTY